MYDDIWCDIHLHVFIRLWWFLVIFFYFIFSEQMVRLDWILVAVTPKEFIEILKSDHGKPPNLYKTLTEFQIKNDRKIISRKRSPSQIYYKFSQNTNIVHLFIKTGVEINTRTKPIHNLHHNSWDDWICYPRKRRRPYERKNFFLKNFFFQRIWNNLKELKQTQNFPEAQFMEGPLFIQKTTETTTKTVFRMIY